MLMSIALLASSAEELLKDINITYSKENYQNIFKNLNELTISSFESNSTQKMIKEDFEELLPNYLNNEDIFSQVNLKQLKKDNIYKHKWREFISASLVYMKYLESQEEFEREERIMKRNLINFNSLMVNSQELVDYIIALILYEKTYFYEGLNNTKIISITKEYPPVDPSIYFDKLHTERDNLLYLIDHMNDIDEKEMNDYETSDYKRLMTRVKSSAKKHINNNFKKMEIATKNDSPNTLKDYYEDLKKEEKKHMDFWSKIKLFFYTMMAKVFQIFFGYNMFHDYMGDYIGKTVALVSIPKYNNLYIKHIEVRNQYNALIKSEKHD